MWKKVKAFYNKHDCNYSEGIVDPFEFHKTFYKIMVLFKVADIEHKHKLTWLNQNALIIASGVIASILTFISLCHGLQIFQILDITEAGTYLIIMLYELLIQTSIRINLPQYHNFLRSMKDDFHFICTEGGRYRANRISIYFAIFIDRVSRIICCKLKGAFTFLGQKYFENQLLTWKICIFACMFTASIGFGVCLFTFVLLLFYLATHKPGEEGSRPLLFPFWLPGIDFGKTPYFEVAFIFSNLCTALYAYNYIFMLQTQIVWIRHITSKVDIVVWSIEDLLDGIQPATNEQERKYYSEVVKHRLSKIVAHHHAMLRTMEDYALVYKKMLMFEQKCCGPVVCLTAYCTVTKLEMDGEIQPVLPLLCFGTTVLHFIPSYFCTFLAEKVRSVCDACWNTEFWIAGSVVRPYMVLMMQRALRPLPLTAPGFESISIETFSKKMTSAYSFFNMLRQTDIK